MLLKELLQGVEVLQTIGDTSQEVGNITQSSRDITPNTLFFAIKGAHTDGHRFIPEVIAQQGYEPRHGTDSRPLLWAPQ